MHIGWQVKDSVRLLEKPYAGLVGEIRYIFRSWVFVYSRTHAENAGVLVAKSRQLAKVGATGVGGIGGEGAESQQSRPPVIQRVNGPGGFRRPGGGSGGGGKDSLFADRALIGKTARIVAVSRLCLWACVSRPVSRQSLNGLSCLVWYFSMCRAP